MGSTIYSMVKQVLADSKEKLAAMNTVNSDRASMSPVKEKQAQAAYTLPEAEKVASALEHIAENLHLIDDNRTMQEKVAEYIAIQEMILKQADGLGDVGKGPHQQQEAPSSFQSPMTPSLSGEQVGAASNQLQNFESDKGSDGVLEAGQSGEASSEHQPPMGVEPGEAPYGASASNAL